MADPVASDWRWWRERRPSAGPLHLDTAQRLYERRGYLREPARDWQIRNVGLLAYRLAL